MICDPESPILGGGWGGGTSINKTTPSLGAIYGFEMVCACGRGGGSLLCDPESPILGGGGGGGTSINKCTNDMESQWVIQLSSTTWCDILASSCLFLECDKSRFSLFMVFL